MQQPTYARSRGGNLAIGALPFVLQIQYAEVDPYKLRFVYSALFVRCLVTTHKCVWHEIGLMDPLRRKLRQRS